MTAVLFIFRRAVFWDGIPRIHNRHGLSHYLEEENMNKKWFGVLFLALLIGIAGFNLYSDRKDVTTIENTGMAVNDDVTGIAKGEKHLISP
jgi:hypothetical protein